jgi:hypothetical protein
MHSTYCALFWRCETEDAIQHRGEWKWTTNKRRPESRGASKTARESGHLRDGQDGGQCQAKRMAEDSDRRHRLGRPRLTREGERGHDERRFGTEAAGSRADGITGDSRAFRRLLGRRAQLAAPYCVY